MQYGVQQRELKFLLDPGDPVGPNVNVHIELRDVGALGTSSTVVNAAGTRFNVAIALPTHVAGSQSFRLLISRTCNEQQLCVLYARLVRRREAVVVVVDSLDE